MTAQPPYRPSSLPLSESRRTRISSVTDAAGGLFSVSGFQEIQGTGETTFVVNFPVRFFEMPIAGFGSHLGGLTGAVSYVNSGNFPSVSVMVIAWQTENGPNTGSPYYTGASIAAVVSGRQDQMVTVHYEFKGKAMTYLPTGGTA